MKNFILAFLLLIGGLGVNAHAQFEYPGGWSPGTIKPQGIYYPVSSTTTNQTMSAYQSASTLIYVGTVAHGQFTLPTCSTQLGIDYTFVDDTTNYIAILPQSTDTINIASTSMGKGVNNVSATAIGNNITLICRSFGQWSIEGSNGTWASGN